MYLNPFITIIKENGEKIMPDDKVFYTAKPVHKRVSKEEFDRFIENYPRPLTYDVTGICEPPAVSYNDFKLANRWPYSIVASTHIYDDDPKGYYYEPEEKRSYIIIENYQELFDSKTGYMA